MQQQPFQDPSLPLWPRLVCRWGWQSLYSGTVVFYQQVVALAAVVAMTRGTPAPAATVSATARPAAAPPTASVCIPTKTFQSFSYNQRLSEVRCKLISVNPRL